MTEARTVRRGPKAEGDWAYLRESREAVGLSQGQLAARVGIKPRTVCKWENGESVPHPRYILPLASALAVEFTDLAVQIAIFFSQR